jgi:adenine-specific DNA methylase
VTDTPRLIEFAFPLKQASLDSVYEKNVRHGHISTLHIRPARRPLAACRAALVATLLPDPSAEPKPAGMNEEEWQKEIARRRQALCEKIGGKVVKRIERKKMPKCQCARSMPTKRFTYRPGPSSARTACFCRCFLLCLAAFFAATAQSFCAK